MKRGLIAFAVGSLVFAAVYASAASLTVTSGVLQSGGGNTGTCDADGVTATYTLVWNNATSDYDIDKVTVTGIASACATPPSRSTWPMLPEPRSAMWPRRCRPVGATS